MTLQTRLIESLAKAGTYNRGVQAAPVAVLWTDKEVRDWEGEWRGG